MEQSSWTVLRKVRLTLNSMLGLGLFTCTNMYPASPALFIAGVLLWIHGRVGQT